MFNMHRYFINLNNHNIYQINQPIDTIKKAYLKLCKQNLDNDFYLAVYKKLCNSTDLNNDYLILDFYLNNVVLTHLSDLTKPVMINNQTLHLKQNAFDHILKMSDQNYTINSMLTNIINKLMPMYAKNIMICN